MILPISPLPRNSHAFSWNGTPWVICSEVFPGSVRSVLFTLAAAFHWLWATNDHILPFLEPGQATDFASWRPQNFVISRATPTMFLQMNSGGCGVYLFFATMTVISIPYIVYLLPETKAVPLEEMVRLFAPGMSSWGANEKVMAELQHERAGEQGQPLFIHQDKDKQEARHVEEGESKV